MPKLMIVDELGYVPLSPTGAERLGVSRDTFYTYFPQARARSQAAMAATTEKA